LDEEICVDHILQELEADDSGDNRSIQQIGGENYYVDDFHTFDSPCRDIVSSDNLVVNHVGKEGRDEGLLAALEEPLAGIEVTKASNSNAHG